METLQEIKKIDTIKEADKTPLREVRQTSGSVAVLEALVAI